MVIIIFPASVVVSARGAERDWKRAPALPIISTDSLKQIAGGADQAIELPDGYEVTFAIFGKGARWPRTAQTTSRSVASSAANLPRLHSTLMI